VAKASAKLDPAVKDSVALLQHKEQDAELQLLDKTQQEINSLAELVWSTLESELSSQVEAVIGRSTKAIGFLALPEQANVRVTSSDVSEASVGKLVQDMETRRGVAGELAQERVLDMELTYLKAVNGMIRGQLATAIGRILANYE